MDVRMFYDHLFGDVLGLDALGLENTERDLVRMIDTMTLTTFSNYVPAIYKTRIALHDRSKIVRKDKWEEGTEYYLDDPVLDKFNLEILSIDHIEPANLNMDPYDPSSSAFYNSILASRNNMTLESVLFGSEYTYNRTLIDSALPYKRYEELRGPRTLYLKNWNLDGDVYVDLQVRWPNVRSLPQEYFESFTTLAAYDCKRTLWHSLRNIEDIVTPTGNLQLRFDWSSAELERADFLRELERKSIPDRTRAHYFYIL